MKATSVSPLCSPGIQELNDLFNSLKRPYGQDEIVRFNLAYQRLYPQLSRSEKLCAEKLVDDLLVDLENKNLAAKIYGIV
jgi:hypothetical protein